ncbi:Rho binding incomplete domain containing protein [Pandoravirus salinus]|uniref:Rho binding incomplete domain containing protein n=1 Tax=Pandoravirus salinus TaxID=1349410 RepID=S4VVG0_9VIRU|nr:Rho binding incomplete domain [Pandoravirus salinus]AGO84609.2 Rho binding incomplete domain containing protein [Pandoravirus salinus]
MQAKARKSDPPCVAPTRTSNRDAQVVGDGDGDDDWAPPRAPPKPTLTICMDTRRQAGRRGARVSISASAAAAANGAPPKSPEKTPHVEPAPAVARPAEAPARKPKRCPWGRPLVADPSMEKASDVAVERDPVRAHNDVACAPTETGIAGPKPVYVARAPVSAALETQSRARGDAMRVGVVKDDAGNADGATNGSDDRDDLDESAPCDGEGRRDHGARDSRRPTDADRAAAGDKAPHRHHDSGQPRVRWCRRDAAPIAKTQQRERLTRRLISALVARPYGLTLDEVATLAEETLDKPCTVHDARLVVAELPRDMVVVRRMMTPWFVPRTAAALDTRVALDRVVAPAVARVLRQRNAGTGVDMRHLDVTVLTNTGTSLRVHAVNYANGSIRGLLGMLTGVVGRIENIASRTVVYPAWCVRATALLRPLDNNAPVGAATAADGANRDNDEAASEPSEQPDATSEAGPVGQMAKTVTTTRAQSTPLGATVCDAAVSRAARVTVVLVETIADAAAACTHATEVAMASGAPIVVDARGLMVGRHARGAPVGMLQIGVPGCGPVYQLDMVGLHGLWFADPDHGHATGSSELFTALGVAALLGDPRIAKAVFDSRPMAQVFWRRASCPMANVFDLRLAARALGAHVRSGWSDSDALASVGMTIDADANELDAMTATDAWAWHRRPMAPRARAAAARQAVALARAYQKVNPALPNECTRDDATDEVSTG